MVLMLCRFSEISPDINPNCNWEVSGCNNSCTLLQQPSLSPSAAPQLPAISPSPQNPGGLGAGIGVGHHRVIQHSLMLLSSHSVALSCPMCSTGLLIDPEAAACLKLVHWLHIPAAVIKFR